MDETTFDADINPVLRFLRRLDFDPTASGHGLVVEHPRSTSGSRLSPLIAVADEEGYRVTVGVFEEEEIRPALSVTFDREHVPVIGSDTFARRCDPQHAFSELIDQVRRIYAHSRDYYSI